MKECHLYLLQLVLYVQTYWLMSSTLTCWFMRDTWNIILPGYARDSDINATEILFFYIDTEIASMPHLYTRLHSFYSESRIRSTGQPKN